MRVVVITPPAPVVTWDQAKAHLKVDDDGERTYVEALIAAATSHIDGPGGWLRRSIGQQTLEARFDLTSCSRSLRLRFGSVIELVSVSYLDVNGIEQTASNADFALYGDDLAPAGDVFPWEGASIKREAGRVRYKAGFADVPAAITAAILLMVGDLYRFRTTATDTNQTPVSIPMSTTVETLLMPWRLFL